MPIYQYKCQKCGVEMELIQEIGSDTRPVCCGEEMVKLPTFPSLVIMKGGGGGGYPSRRKFIHGSAPNTTRSTKPWLSDDPYKKINYMGTKDGGFEANTET